MATALCPTCSSDIDASNTHCPVCLRARPPEEVRAAPRARPAARSWRGRAAAAGGAALLLALLFASRRSEPEPPAARAPAFAPPPAPAPEPEPPPPPPPPTSPEGDVFIRQQTPAVAEPLDEPRRRRPAAKRPTRASWNVRGRVYDLATLKPVQGARLVFQDKESGAAFSASTDAAGRYKASLPKIDEGGYEVTVSHKKYSRVYLEEMSPPYRAQNVSRRKRAAEETKSADVLHVPLLPERSASGMDYDIVLLPR